ncbi:DUF5107 domain-containing protein [Fonticella tunisiensis]|uniref:Galactose mutarotase-like enzyme n=1 Tax=Fonticella tunisiensis TaxID=1096341 RepID=A0A4R7KAW2_9CLOT|nr:DUF4432 family protein [Fonticella tunisiensis]TDT52023.1 galactose mutarotase-like enzyme [Fonticella tunisiensis]
MILESIFKGEKALILESEVLKVVVLPDIGGKIASIYHKGKDFELLFQNKEKIYRRPELYAAFENYDASGFDDAFPTIDACRVMYDGKKVLYPDHGEVWTSSFNYKIEDNRAYLWFKSAILPYEYKKVLELDGDRLLLKYEIINTGKDAFPCIWAMHCLINCHEDMELIFPEGTSEVINVHESSRLGEVNKVHSYPVTKDLDGRDYRLDRVLGREANHSEKYYVNGKVREGRCGAYYPHKDITYSVKFDKEKLPYIGFWVTEGGFRGDYNCALEPTNGFYDSIDITAKNGKVYSLDPGKELKFDIEINLK